MERVRKYSRQREALLKLLQNVKTHPDAGWLYARLKQDFPNISLATVYRNLNLLCETGEIVRLDVGTGIEHYDAATENHYHFVCKNCGAILDLDLPELAGLDHGIELQYGVRVNRHSLIFYGFCQQCK